MQRSDNNFGIAKRPLQSRVCLDGWTGAVNGIVNFTSVLFKQGDSLVPTLDANIGSFIQVTEYGIYAATFCIYDSVTTSHWYLGKNAVSASDMNNATDGRLWAQTDVAVATHRFQITSVPVECFPGDRIMVTELTAGSPAVCRLDVSRIS